MIGSQLKFAARARDTYYYDGLRENLMDSELLQLLQECELSGEVIGWMRDEWGIMCVRHLARWCSHVSEVTRYKLRGERSLSLISQRHGKLRRGA